MPSSGELSRWDDARAFLAVARTGSLTAAAALLKSGVATVSRRVDRLEADLAVPLFARHQTGYRLTDQGESLLPKAEALERAARDFGRSATEAAEAVGRVRVATAENLATSIIIPALPALLDRHPKLTLEVVTDIATANLHRRDADLAVHMVKPERGNVTLRRIGTLGFGLYGSPDYVAKRPGGPDAGSLDEDRLVAWSESQGHLTIARWSARALRDRAPALATTSLATQLSAAAAGIGLAVLPHFLAAEADLRRVPVELGIDQAIWLVVHADLSASRRVRVVADHLVETIRDHQDRLTPDLP